MGKIVVASYNQITGFSEGRYEMGNVVVFSGEFDYKMPRLLSGPDRKQLIETQLAWIRVSLLKEIDQVSKIYLYVGLVGWESSKALIAELLRLGKEVVMVSCKCKEYEKNCLAGIFHIKYHPSECGGMDTCAEIIRQYSVKKA